MAKKITRQSVIKIGDLVAALREQGIDYLTPTDSKADRPLDVQSLIERLASHTNARLRQSLIALFLLKPHLANYASLLRTRLNHRAALRI